jgi:uncharacterized protein YPO0396
MKRRACCAKRPSDLSDEIRKLRTGDREVSFKTEAPQAVRLRELLRAELHLSANEVIFLCSLLQIPTQDWQDAVEGVLGFNRFVLLVPPQHYSGCHAPVPRAPPSGEPARRGPAG